MGDVSFGSVQRVGVKGHNNIATLQHGQPDQLNRQNLKTRLLGLLSLNLILNQILH